jgi:phosphatidylglycerophosphatase A
MPIIKESSDELNPATVTTASVPSAPRQRTLADYLALAIATCGVGYMPIAPGTWGSLVGVGIYVLLRLATESLATPNRTAEILFLALELPTILLVTFVGIWAASRVERRERKKDPGKVVIDEVAGQLIALLPIGLALTTSWRAWTVVAFFLFRASDIVKPYPARKLESLPSGLGIVADDVAAGAYAALVVALGVLLQRFW